MIAFSGCMNASRTHEAGTESDPSILRGTAFSLLIP